jgi:transposase-like protein
MQRRKWDAKTKALIVLEGFKGKPVSEICTEHQISQSLYYQWRDQFLANAGNVSNMLLACLYQHAKFIAIHK